jgi:glycosyltransferase involved in cell wall biosynthesis
VIIPAHNEEARLAATCNALHEQDFSPHEIIVIANGCTDRTADLARGCCHRLVVLPRKGLCRARNLGARIARGELLVFLDADTILDSHALRVVAEKFSRRDAAATLKGRPDNRDLAYRAIYFVKNATHRSLVHTGSSGVIICWRTDFLNIGGFDERLEVRENSDLIRRLKRSGRYRYIGEAAATTSMRRYEQCGVGRVMWLWTKLWLEAFFRDLHHRRYETVR